MKQILEQNIIDSEMFKFLTCQNQYSFLWIRLSFTNVICNQAYDLQNVHEL